MDRILLSDADDTWEPTYLEEINIKHFTLASVFVSAYTCKLRDSRYEVIYRSDVSSGYINNYFKSRIAGWGVHTSSVVIESNTFAQAEAFLFYLIHTIYSIVAYRYDGQCHSKIS